MSIPSNTPGTILSWHGMPPLSPGALQGAALGLVLLRVKVMKRSLRRGWALVLGCILELNNALRNAVEWEKGNNHFIELAVWYRRTGKLNLMFPSFSVNWVSEGEDEISSLDQVFSSWFFYLLCSASLWVQSKALWSHYKDCFVFNRLWIKAHMTLGKLLQISVMKCLEICKHTCPKY